LNSAKRTYEHKLREALSEKCKHCGQANLYQGQSFFTPDGKAHNNQWGQYYMGDCLDRIWANVGDGYRLTDLTRDSLNCLTECLVKGKVQYNLLHETLQRHIINHIVEGTNA